VHLHTHSDFSLLDGKSSIKEIVELAVKYNQPGVAITDHGSMAGTVQLLEQANALKKAGTDFTPIPGLEAYYVEDAEIIKTQRAQGITPNRNRYHMILLAVNTTGYKNLMKIQSVSSMENYYFKPLVDDALLAENHEGIVATSGCLGSIVNKLLMEGEFQKAVAVASRHQDLFGRDNYFVEVQNHNIPDQLQIIPDQIRLAKAIGAPLLATQDSHYNHKHEAEMHDSLITMQTAGAKLADEHRFRFSSDENFFRTSEEMWELFPHSEFPDACANTLVIEERARDIEIPLHSSDNYLIPTFPTDDGKTEAEQLREDVIIGARERYGVGKDKKLPENVTEKIDFELGVINSMGFNGYFLMVADLIKAAQNMGYLVGPGRGSAPGSIVSYTTGITKVDPIHYGLYFERFLNPGRKSMPDIDIDFEPASRAPMVKYVQEKYGHDRVAKIATYSVFKPKSALQKAAFILGLSNKVGSIASGLWPGTIDGVEAKLWQVMQEKSPPEDSSYYHHWRAGRALREFSQRDDEIREMFRVALGVEGVHNNHGTHAAAVLITPEALTNFVPLHRSKKEDDNVPVCEYDKDDAEAIGGLKMDFLGLINLEIIKKALVSIKRDMGVDVDLDKIPLDDPKTFKMLASGETDGVFQLTSPGMRDLLRRVNPDSVEDLSAVIALYRPGPMGTDLHLAYAEAKNGRARVEVPHEYMHEMFADTYGVLCYQEQVMALSQHYAGYNATEADDFRKAVGKKDAVKLAAQEIPFKAGVIERGYGEQVANDLWAMIPPFAAYAFNKAHSVVYAYVAYWTAWLKANYTAQYAAACIDTQDRDRRTAQVASARKMHVNVFPPNINQSNGDSTTTKDGIWLGLSGVRNCGGSTLTNILAERSRGGDFTSIGDFMVRMAGAGGINKQALFHLTAAGAFDTLIGSRMSLHVNLEKMLAESRVTSKSTKAKVGMFDLFDAIVEEEPLSEFKLNGDDYSIAEKIAAEIEALGFAAGDHPYSLIKNIIPSYQADGKIDPRAIEMGVFVRAISKVDSEIERNERDGIRSIAEGSQVFLYGTITAHKVKGAKNGNGRPQHNFLLENDNGDIVDVIWYGGTEDAIANGQFAVVGGTYQVRELSDADGNPYDKVEIRATNVSSSSIDDIISGNSGGLVTSASSEDLARAMTNRKRAERRGTRGSDVVEETPATQSQDDEYQALIASRRNRRRGSDETDSAVAVAEAPVDAAVPAAKEELTAVTFFATSQDEVRDLMDAMESMVEGSVFITILHGKKKYAAEEGSKISLRGIQRIAKITGVEFEHK
jgi:DNA polymerase-3 subunit alpha